MDEKYIEYLFYGLLFLTVFVDLVYFILLNYRSWKRNNAPVEACRAVAYYKDPEMQATIGGRSNTYVFHITFHAESGDILNLYMGRDPYHRIPEGAWGQLTWQGERFWNFTMDDGQEIRQ